MEQSCGGQGRVMNAQPRLLSWKAMPVLCLAGMGNMQETGMAQYLTTKLSNTTLVFGAN